MVSRRALLMTGGAAVLILGAAGSCTYQSAQRLDAVREPWREAEEGFGDVRLNALAYAILAPSPHNRQPWLIELIGEDRLTGRSRSAWAPSWNCCDKRPPSRDISRM